MARAGALLEGRLGRDFPGGSRQSRKPKRHVWYVWHGMLVSPFYSCSLESLQTSCEDRNEYRQRHSEAAGVAEAGAAMMTVYRATTAPRQAAI
jgi:hypothetical protein